MIGNFTAPRSARSARNSRFTRGSQPQIVTFDEGGPQTFIDGQDVPGFPFIKVRKFGGAVIEQTAGGKGKVTSLVAADSGYFVGKTDLVPKGTWEMVYKFNLFATNVQSDVFINDGEHSANDALEPATYLVGLTVFSDGRVFARHRNAGSDLLPVGPQLTSYSLGVTGEVVCKIGKTGSLYTFDFNGSTTSIAISSVLAHTKEQAILGEMFSSVTATVEFDDISGIS